MHEGLSGEGEGRQRGRRLVSGSELRCTVSAFIALRILRILFRDMMRWDLLALSIALEVFWTRHEPRRTYMLDFVGHESSILCVTT